MNSKNLRTVLILALAALIIPVINSVYEILPRPVWVLCVIAGIALLVTAVVLGKKQKKEPNKNTELCSDIKIIMLETNGRNYIISEGAGYSIDDNGFEGVMSYIERGIWHICDNSQTVSAPIELTVPKNAVIGFFKAELNRGNIFINSLKVRSVAFSVHTGRAEVHSLITDTLDAEAGNGAIILDGAVKGNVKIACGGGNIKMELDNDITDFNITVQTGRGTARAGEEIFDERRRTGTIDNGAAQAMSISCGLGRVDVDFGRISENEQG